MHALMHRKVSLHHSDINKYEDKSVQMVLEGSLDNLPPLSTKLVRVFISSTFSGDFLHLLLFFYLFDCFVRG